MKVAHFPRYAAGLAFGFGIGMALSAGGCGGNTIDVPDAGGSGESTGSAASGSSSQTGSSSGSAATGSSGSSSGVAGAGSVSGSPGSGLSSGVPSSGTSSGTGGSGMAGSGTGGSGISSGSSSSGASSGSGGATCNGTRCTGGELCCPGFDQYCTPMCMKVQTCPVLGRPCRVPDAGTTPDSGTGGLHWYLSCGYPVCPAPGGNGSGSSASGAGPTTVDASAPCPPLGSACSAQGATCGTPSALNCGRVEVCQTSQPVICPVSSRKFKSGIQYVDDAELERLHDETMRVRLATYNYTPQVDDPSIKHLGFIIEDNPESLAVDRVHNRVDLYGYLSMVVAAMQVQDKEIAELRAQLAKAHANACSE